MSMANGIRVSIDRTTRVSDREWDEIGEFGSRYVDGPFVDKLQAKRYVVRMRGDDRRLVGIAAVDVVHLTHAKRTVTVIYAASALFDDEARGQGYVQRTGFRFFLRAKALRPWRPVFVAFVSYSWRSYLSLARNFTHYWPRHDILLPDWEAGLCEKLGQQLFGEQYEPGTGLVRALDRRLYPDHVAIPQHVLADPNVGYFAVRNAGYANGDSLICLAPLNFINWWTAARRIVGRQLKR